MVQAETQTALIRYSALCLSCFLRHAELCMRPVYDMCLWSRYDKLVGMFSGKDVPAVGISIGIERVFKILQVLCQTQSSGTERWKGNTTTACSTESFV